MEREISTLPLLSMLNDMRGDYEISNEYLQNINEGTFKEQNTKILLTLKGNTTDTEKFLDKIKSDLRGEQGSEISLDFAPDTEITTTAIKFNTRIQHLSPLVLDIDGDQIIFNKIGVRM